MRGMISDMKRIGNRGGEKQPAPQSRQDGALRIGRYVRWLYGEQTPPATLAEPLIDAAFDEIAAIADQDVRHRLLREAMDRAYQGLGDA